MHDISALEQWKNRSSSSSPGKSIKLQNANQLLIAKIVNYSWRSNTVLARLEEVDRFLKTCWKAPTVMSWWAEEATAHWATDVSKVKRIPPLVKKKQWYSDNLQLFFCAIKKKRPSRPRVCVAFWLIDLFLTRGIQNICRAHTGHQLITGRGQRCTFIQS